MRSLKWPGRQLGKLLPPPASPLSLVFTRTLVAMGTGRGGVLSRSFFKGGLLAPAVGSQPPAVSSFRICLSCRKPLYPRVWPSQGDPHSMVDGGSRVQPLSPIQVTKMVIYAPEFPCGVDGGSVGPVWQFDIFLYIILHLPPHFYRLNL